MQATELKVETNVAGSPVEPQTAWDVEAVRELTALELSLVGGGTIAVVFA
jgi:hypothetical protein